MCKGLKFSFKIDRKLIGMQEFLDPGHFSILFYDRTRHLNVFWEMASLILAFLIDIVRIFTGHNLKK